MFKVNKMIIENKSYETVNSFTKETGCTYVHKLLQGMFIYV